MIPIDSDFGNKRLHVVTPCCRPDNLRTIGMSFAAMNAWSVRKNGQFDLKWWIVLDMNRLSVDDVNKVALDISNLPCCQHQTATILLNKSKGSAGHQHRNFVLDILEERNEKGWFYSVDDDNIIHENFHEVIEELKDGVTAVVVNQILKNGEPNRSPVDNTTPLIATPENMKVFFVDTGQAIFNLEKIKGMRFEQDKYNADGLFVEKLFNKEGNFAFINKDLSYYNYLEPNNQQFSIEKI
jgi:hypothetical protein